MRILRFALISIILFGQNVFASGICRDISYNDITICLDDTYVTETQGSNLVIKKKNALDMGYVVMGMSPGKNYDENVKRTCEENDAIQCISSGICGNNELKGKRLEYIDKKYQNDITNISCFVERAEIVIIYHGVSAHSDLLDAVISSARMKSK